MKLTTKDILNLQIELQGYQKDGEIILKGLLTQKLKQSVKIKLNRLAEEVNKEVSLFEKAKKDIFTQYGEEKDNQLVIKPENLEVADKELKEVIESEVELDIKKLLFGMSEESLDTIDDDSYYPVMYKLLSNEK
jgi:hypothetical protein